MKEFHFEIEKTSFVQSILHALLTVFHVWSTFTWTGPFPCVEHIHVDRSFSLTNL